VGIIGYVAIRSLTNSIEIIEYRPKFLGLVGRKEIATNLALIYLGVRSFS
jgi:hypothetical protein